MVDIPAMLKEKELSMENIPFSPAELAELLKLIKDGTISGTIGKKVLEKMFEEDKTPKAIVEENNWAQMSDTSELEGIIAQVIEDNPKSIEDIGAGNQKAYGFLTGQVMKATKGQANPQVANKIIREPVSYTPLDVYKRQRRRSWMRSSPKKAGRMCLRASPTP